MATVRIEWEGAVDLPVVILIVRLQFEASSNSKAGIWRSPHIRGAATLPLNIAGIY